MKDSFALFMSSGTITVVGLGQLLNQEWLYALALALALPALITIAVKLHKENK